MNDSGPASSAHQSVLTERPDADRGPMDTTILWYVMAIGVAVLVGVVVWKFLEGKADRGNR